MPAHTFIASALGVVHAGATPVFCDVEDGTGPDRLRSAAEAAVDRAPRRSFAVHLYGQACDMDAVRAFARPPRPAGGRGRRPGPRRDAGSGRAPARWAHVAAFSFYPEQEPRGARRRRRDLHRRRRDRRAQPSPPRPRPARQGRARRGGLQRAARRPAGRVACRSSCRDLDAGNARGAGHAARLPGAAPEACRACSRSRAPDCVYHLFPVRVADRDALRAHLARPGSGPGSTTAPGVHHQPPLQPALASRTARLSTDLERAVRWAREELSLPMFAELRRTEVERVAEAMRGLRRGDR